MTFFIISISLLIIAICYFIIRKNRSAIARYLMKVKMKHTMRTLREAIHDADKDKKTTGRKNIVVYNTTTKTFEPVQKKLLKQVANHNKRKKVKSEINTNRIKQIEKKSLYVTR